MVRSPIAEAYLERLTDRDVLVLTSAAEHEQGPDRARHLLGSDPDRLERLLGSRQVFEAVFTDGSRGHELVGASPFLVFAVCVQRAVAELESATYVMDWIGPGRRAPVFDAARLREFTARGETRLFLAQLLASYTHVASGSVVTLTRRGLRRQRFSELDPVRLASLLDVVSDEERPGILRRLGDLALFLTGVFPDYVARRGFSEIEEGRLVRSGVYGPSARRPTRGLAVGRPGSTGGGEPARPIGTTLVQVGFPAGPGSCSRRHLDARRARRPIRGGSKDPGHDHGKVHLHRAGAPVRDARRLILPIGRGAVTTLGTSWKMP